MAIKFFDGFDMYTQAQVSRRWTGTPGSPNNIVTPGRFGVGQAWRGDTNGNPMYAQFSVGAPVSTVSVGIAVKPNTSLAGHAAAGTTYFTFINGGTAGTIICQLGVTSSGRVVFGRTDYGAALLCQSAAGAIVADQYSYLEVELTRNAATGAVNIYQNGTLIASASAVNTGASDIDTIGLTKTGENPGQTREFDDFYVTNTATKLGECRVETLRPAADDSVQWTPNASTNVSRVNTTTVDDDTTYNASSTVGQIDIFTVADLASAPAAVRAVQVTLVARKDDAATREVRAKMVNGATTTNGATRALGASYAQWVDLYETNPDTAAAFTGANVNAMKIGYEVVT